MSWQSFSSWPLRDLTFDVLYLAIGNSSLSIYLDQERRFVCILGQAPYKRKILSGPREVSPSQNRSQSRKSASSQLWFSGCSSSDLLQAKDTLLFKSMISVVGRNPHSKQLQLYEWSRRASKCRYTLIIFWIFRSLFRRPSNIFATPIGKCCWGESHRYQHTSSPIGKMSLKL